MPDTNHPSSEEAASQCLAAREIRAALVGYMRAAQVESAELVAAILYLDAEIERLAPLSKPSQRP